jgi:hypothetical protein
MATYKSAWINNFGLYVCMALLCSCCTSIVLKQGQPLSTIAFSIEITDEDQKIAADSLGAALARRLLIFSEDRKTFTLVKPGTPADFHFKIQINSFHLVPVDVQESLNQERAKIEGKFERRRDSLEKSVSAAQIATANVVSNIAFNALLFPLGFVGVVVITKDNFVPKGPSYLEQRDLDALTRKAKFKYSASLTGQKNQIQWENQGQSELTITSAMSEKEQLYVLVRNALLDFEGKMPFLK